MMGKIFSRLKSQQGLKFGVLMVLGVLGSLGVFLLMPDPSHAQFQNLPTPQVHPLPAQLAQWSDSPEAGDYFEEVQPTPLGYLVWSEFPVRVYIEPVRDQGDRVQQAWVAAIQQAMQDWGQYIPLVEVTEKTEANMLWVRSRPPLRPTLDRENNRLIIPNSRNAEATYQFDLKNNTLVHRFTIHLSPHQSANLTQGTARHELGHALGIWGHSPLETDVLYATQVRTPPPISPRDLNTLKKVYQQPTRLGWKIHE